MQQKHAQRVWNAVRAKCKKHSVQGRGGARRTGSKNVGGAKRVMCRKGGGDANGEEAQERRWSRESEFCELGRSDFSSVEEVLHAIKTAETNL